MALQLIFPDDDVIEGWNTRLSYGSVESTGSNTNLSDLVSFVQAFSVYTSKERSILLKATGKERAFAETLIPVNFIKDNSDSIKGLMYITEIAKSETQLESFNKEGGVGINSLNITKGTKESFNISYSLDMTITNPDIMNNDLRYAGLVTLNRLFLFMYGWSTGSEIDFYNAPIITPNMQIDLKTENKGFWKASLARLCKFDFSFEQNGYLGGKLEFAAPNNATLAILKGNSIAYKVKSKLGLGVRKHSMTLSNRDIRDQKGDKLTYGFKRGRIPDENGARLTTEPFIQISKTKFAENVESDDQDNLFNIDFKSKAKDFLGSATGSVQDPNPSRPYFYLGWVLEAIAESVK